MNAIIKTPNAIAIKIGYVALLFILLLGGYLIGSQYLKDSKPQALCNDQSKATHTYNEYMEACENMVKEAAELYEQSQSMADHLNRQGFDFNTRQAILAKK